MKIADRYIKLVEWSEEDQRYVGSSPGFIGPCCHGEDEAEVYRQLCTIVDEWVIIHQEEGLPLPESFADRTFSGKFVLRVGQDLHKALTISAMKSGKSLNTLCTNFLHDAILQRPFSPSNPTVI
jgi:predicted HicB family RNase H-like nuclease